MVTKKKISTAAEFKKNLYTELTLPSGNVCLARRPGLDTFLKNKQVPNALLPFITQAMQAAKGGKREGNPVNLNDLADLDTLAEISSFNDIVLCATVFQPKVYLPPEDGDDRDETKLYADEVDELDRQFVFQWAVGGSADLEKFRKELASMLSTMVPGEEVGNSS